MLSLPNRLEWVIGRTESDSQRNRSFENKVSQLYFSRFEKDAKNRNDSLYTPSKCVRYEWFQLIVGWHSDVAIIPGRRSLPSSTRICKNLSLGQNGVTALWSYYRAFNCFVIVIMLFQNLFSFFYEAMTTCVHDSLGSYSLFPFLKTLFTRIVIIFLTRITEITDARLMVENSTHWVNLLIHHNNSPNRDRFAPTRYIIIEFRNRFSN